MHPFYKSLYLINTYRIHVAAIFALLLILYITPFHSSLIAPYFPQSIIYYMTITFFTMSLAATYISNKYFDYAEDHISQKTEARRSPTLAYIATAMYLLPLIALFLFKAPIVPYLALVPITLAYSFPIAGVRIKQQFLLKNLYAAGVWWISVAVAIAFYSPSNLTLLDAMRLSFDVFLLLMIFELLWDIRDVKGDAAVGNKTVPVILGVTFTKIVILGLLTTSWWLGNVETLSLLSLNMLYLGIVTMFAKTSFSHYYYHSVIYVQGMFLLTQLLVYY